MLVTVRYGRTNPEGKTRDVRFVKGAVTREVRTLRAAASPVPGDREGGVDSSRTATISLTARLRTPDLATTAAMSREHQPRRRTRPELG